MFTTLRVLHLEDRTPGPVLDVSKGRCADLLGLRARMGGRRWPSSANWARRVAPASMGGLAMIGARQAFPMGAASR